MMKEVLFYSFYNDFDRFRPCERMRKHAFAGRNTQHRQQQKRFFFKVCWLDALFPENSVLVQHPNASRNMQQLNDH